ncbi:hypothetical protein ACF0H5_019405 [Mactra antiquata]
MRFQNETCTVLPSDSFLTDESRYSYRCNSTVYQVTVHPPHGESFNNRIFDCRDAIQPDGPGSTWMIKLVQEVTEGDDITFVCRVSSNETYTNWDLNFGSNTGAAGVMNGGCNTSTGTTFLDNTSKYNYTCNNTVYQITKLNVQRSEHNDMYMCTPPSQLEGNGSNWIIKVKAPVTSVTISPANSHVNVTEHTPVEFTCTTSTSRPTASVYTFKWKQQHQNSNYRKYNNNNRL